jgi:hypothetical protein
MLVPKKTFQVQRSRFQIQPTLADKRFLVRYRVCHQAHEGLSRK